MASDMSNTVKITCCGVLAALAAAIMLFTNVPLFLYTVPCLAGMIFMIPAIEFGTRWGILCYAVTSVISLILPTETEALTVFIGFFGFYPILKMVIERIGKKIPEMLVKFAVFNVAIVASYTVIIKILGVNPFETERFGVAVTELLMLAIGNVVFCLIDYALTKIIVLYFIKLRRPVRKMLGLKGKY